MESTHTHLIINTPSNHTQTHISTPYYQHTVIPGGGQCSGILTHTHTHTLLSTHLLITHKHTYPHLIINIPSFQVEDSAVESSRLSERSTLERTVTEWIETMTKLPRDQSSVDGSFGGWLKSGEVLCILVNAIQPGSIPKFNQNTKMPFKQMENISLFLRAVRTLGVREHECFDTSDLFDEKDLAQVLSTLAALGRVNGMQS